MAGPHDWQDGLTYWVRRAARGGPVALPGDPGQPVQVIGSRDLARLVVRLLADDRPGAFHAVGPAEPVTIAGVIETCARASTATPARSAGGQRGAVGLGEKAALARRPCRTSCAFHRVLLDQSLRLAAAMLTPRPIMTRPPVPPIGARRCGDRVNHCRAVPAVAAHALSRMNAMAGNRRPRMSIWAGIGRCPGPRSVNEGRAIVKDTIGFGLAAPTRNPGHSSRPGSICLMTHFC